MKKTLIYLFLMTGVTMTSFAQNNFSYQVQYNLVDVDYTGGDTLYESVCMLNLDSVNNSIQQIEISVGTTLGASDVSSLIIPFNNGTQLALFNNNKKGMARMGNLPATSGNPYYYSVRLKYNDGTYSSPVETSSIAN